MNADPPLRPSGRQDAGPPASKIDLKDAVTRYDAVSALLHWLVAVTVGIQFVVVWYLLSTPRDGAAWQTTFPLHVIVGFSNAVLVLSLLLWRGFHRAPELPSAVPSALRVCGRVINVLLCGVLLLAPVSGYLIAAYSPRGIIDAVVRLPVWGWDDPSLSHLFTQVHSWISAALPALILLHVLLLGVSSRYSPGLVSMMLPRRKPSGRVPAEVSTEPLALQEGRRLARRFRVLGWFAFAVQLSLGLICLLLLAVAASSTAFVAKVDTAAPGVLGAYGGILVLGVTMLAFLYCTRIAKALLAQPARRPGRMRLLRLLGVQSAASFLGMGFALVGAGSSIALLIAKTVSQPPGIAITDPSKIIRALDVFILLANFDVVVAHFVGVVASLWLMAYVNRHWRPVARMPPLPVQSDSAGSGAATPPAPAEPTAAAVDAGMDSEGAGER